MSSNGIDSNSSDDWPCVADDRDAAVGVWSAPGELDLVGDGVRVDDDADDEDELLNEGRGGGDGNGWVATLEAIVDRSRREDEL